MPFPPSEQETSPISPSSLLDETNEPFGTWQSFMTDGFDRAVSARELSRRLLSDIDSQTEDVEPKLLHAIGAKGGGSAWVARMLSETASEQGWSTPILCITKDSETASSLASDLRFFSDRRVALFEVPDVSPYADVNPDRRVQTRRLALLHELVRGDFPLFLVVSAQALVRKVLPKELIEAKSMRFSVGQSIDLENTTSRLTESGYLRVPVVEDVASFAVRGSLLDLWPSGFDEPVRIDLFGDEVESIAFFDPVSQRSGQAVQHDVWVAPAREMLRDADSIRTISERIRRVCDQVDWPSRKTAALVEDVVSGRLGLGEDRWLPAVADLVSLWAYVPRQWPVVVEDPEAVFSSVYDELGRAEQDMAEKVREPHFDVGEFYDQPEKACRNLLDRRVIALHPTEILGRQERLDDDEGQPGTSRIDFDICEFSPSQDEPVVPIDDLSWFQQRMQSARKQGGNEPSGSGSLLPLVSLIRSWLDSGLMVGVVARAVVQAERIGQLLEHRELQVQIHGHAEGPNAVSWPPQQTSAAGSDSTVHLFVGELARGLVAPFERFALITEEEIFGHRKKVRRRRARSSSIRRSFAEDLRHLTPGDLVVHRKHGIGRYEGLLQQKVGDSVVDMVKIVYDGGDKLFLPVYRLDQIQRHAGAEAPAKLDRLGGKTFEKTKKRVSKAVQKMAEQLLRLYAERKTVMVEPVAEEDDEYRAFEATFPFEETQDQAAAIEDVLDDLHKFEPMDRLVCGDVGFGKTEVAIRAAFRIAMQGQQVSVLCPTTVLAQQHLRSFRERLEPYGLNVQGLSRFQTRTQQQQVLRGLHRGTVDVVVGTHRLLSKDVHFKSLGLLVVDEEQRFGVAHKERIKQLKTSVNVLTLTATPIPRTLQMALSGLRDISLIRTAPVDRRSIRTLVTRDDPTVLREAIQRELLRGGQVFYVHNRVQSLYERAARLQRLVPDARIVVAHGQMPEKSLEKAMLAFVEGQFDVLVSTSIIENGLDIPRANTIIIDQATVFGLSQLYQLRGRVGRSKERAYCYLVVPPRYAMSSDARSRIDALVAHTDLGAGFQIASLDLQLRGGGDVLGAQQSGHVASVGFELFREMLEQTVQKLQGKPIERKVEPELNVETDAWIPEEYVDDVGVRLSLYKRLAGAEDLDELHEMAVEIEDRFGPPPPPTLQYLRLMRCKVRLRQLRVLTCEASVRAAMVLLDEDHPLDVEKLVGKVTQKTGLWGMRPDQRLMRRRGLHDKWRDGLDSLETLLDELEQIRTKKGDTSSRS